MEIEYYLLPNGTKKRIRKYKPIKTKDRKIALKTFREWFKKKYFNSGFEIIVIF